MKKYILSLFFLISCMIDAYAHTEQEKIEISGIVLDQSKEPLVGVNVLSLIHISEPTRPIYI